MSLGAEGVIEKVFEPQNVTGGKCWDLPISFASMRTIDDDCSWQQEA